VRHRDADRVQHATEVDVHPVDEGLHGRRGLHRGHAGVRDDNVEAAELREAGVKDRLKLGLDADVALPGDDAAVERLYVLDRLRQVCWRGERVVHAVKGLANVDRDDVRALARQPDRMAAALPAGRPGDEGDLAL
jgi:hypothetical protein